MNFTRTCEMFITRFFDWRQTQVYRNKKEVFMKVDYQSTRVEIVDEDTGEIKVYDEKSTDKSFYKIPSYSYDLNFFVDKNKRKLVCEFSIPKYLYGHNLNLFPHVPDVNFNYLYVFCVKFVKDVLNENLHKVDFEITRLDICYNYKFESAENKQKYLIALERYVATCSNKFMNYKNETFFKKTEGYSVKIYDKTVEFEKNDLKELRLYYAKKGFKKEVSDKILSGFFDFSQNILRVELTARKLELNASYWRTADRRYFFDKREYFRILPLYKTVQGHMKKLGKLGLTIVEKDGIRDVYNIKKIQSELDFFDHFQIEYSELKDGYGKNICYAPRRVDVQYKNLYVERCNPLMWHNLKNFLERNINRKFIADYKSICKMLSIKNVRFGKQLNSYYTKDIALDCYIMTDLWSKVKTTVHDVNKYCSTDKPVDIVDWLEWNKEKLENELGYGRRKINALKGYLSMIELKGHSAMKLQSRTTYNRQMKCYKHISDTYNVYQHSAFVPEKLSFDGMFENYDKKIFV